MGIEARKHSVLLKIFSFFILSMTLFSASRLSVAAPPESAPAPAAQSAPAAQPATDLMPLKKALAALDSNQPMTVHSTVTMTGSQEGLAFTFREKFLITAHRPNEFHVERTQIDAQGIPQKRLTIISNGTTVWTYNPGLRKYSVTSVKKFTAQQNEISALGLVAGGFYLGDGYPLLQGFQNLTPSNSADVLAALANMGMTISRQAETENGQDDYVYGVTLPQGKMAFQFYINTQTQVLSRLDLTGTDKSLKFAFREDIAQIAPQPSVAQSTFVFTPPPGTSKVPNISADPF
jgi:outer membrane lipoprotein-sorting protein